jgi:Bax protein
MKILFLLLFCCTYLLVAADEPKEASLATAKKKPLSVAQKKRAFFKKVVPVIEKVHDELFREYESIKSAIAQHKDQEKIAILKKRYGVESDKELLCVLKPHPKSIAIAQAAMESAWGTSHFFKEANNIFGVWSISAKQKRIAAGSKRGKQTIWLRKFDSLEEAVRDYYFMLSSKKAYRKFKALNCDDKNSVYAILQGLLPYSELGQEYVDSLAGIIRYNKLQHYDTKVAKTSL